MEHAHNVRLRHPPGAAGPLTARGGDPPAASAARSRHVGCHPSRGSRATVFPGFLHVRSPCVTKDDQERVTNLRLYACPDTRFDDPTRPSESH